MSGQNGLPLKYPKKDKWPIGYRWVDKDFDWNSIEGIKTKVWGLDIKPQA